MYKVHQKDETYIYCVERISDNAMIPIDPLNANYQEYLKWLAEGNTPEPADPAE